MAVLAWLSLWLPFVTGVMVASPWGSAYPVYALPGFEPHREDGGAPYWMHVLCGVLRTPAPGMIGGHVRVGWPGSGWGRAPSLRPSTPPRKCGRSHRRQSWDLLERRAHAPRHEVDSFDGDNSCSLMASDRLFLGDDVGIVHHREWGYQADRSSEAARRGFIVPQRLEKL